MFHKVKLALVGAAVIMFSTLANAVPEHDFTKLTPNDFRLLDANMSNDLVSGYVVCESMLTHYVPYVKAKYGTSQPDRVENGMLNIHSYSVTLAMTKNLNTLLDHLPNQMRVHSYRTQSEAILKQRLAQTTIPETFLVQGISNCLYAGLINDIY